jgi:hypothetical protein
MFNVLDDENEVSGWELTEKEIKSVAGFDNLSKEEINAVLNFLIALAKLEIKINET